MSTPAISIILPVYNAAAYIEKTITSLLNQTFTDFELLIIDDGSTDNTIAVIKKFTDDRIKLIVNDKNLGLIKTLNKATALSKGRYIARMDADDIALPERLLLQKEFLDTHPDVSVVAGWINFIDEAGNETGVWDLDRRTNTTSTIEKSLLRENCIAHPTVMIRTVVLQKFLYNEKQLHIEDYDLWLRLIASGHNIAKVQQLVLQYRVHTASITMSKLRKRNFFFKHLNCKYKFVLNAIRKPQINIFVFLVFASMLYDLFMGCGKAVKNAFRN
jgi:glycosyltransferase involved in cell wall biosynthesis